MYEVELEYYLKDALEGGDALQDMIEDGEGPQEVTTFHNAGLLTNDRGVVVRMPDGREFQITIVKSR